MECEVIEIKRLSHEGRGIAHQEGKTTFIANALPGETVKWDVLKRSKRYEEGIATEIINPASTRVAAQCPHYLICGGCSQQHIAPPFQIEYKQAVLLEKLTHLGGVTPQEVLPPLSGPQWGYRTRARLGVKYVVKKNKLLLGFRERKGRYIAEIETCAVLDPKISALFPALKELITSLKVCNSIPLLDVALGTNALAFVFRILEPLAGRDKKILCEFGEKHNVHIYVQLEGLDSVTMLWPTPYEYLKYALPDLEMLFHPLDFTQINRTINQELVSLAVKLLEPAQNENVLDLFCGLGNFTLPLAQAAKAVVGIEGSSKMTARGELNAKHNNIANVQFYAHDLTKPLPDAPWAAATYPKILLDPPRTGAYELIPQLKRFKASRILYISCNPATLARDSKLLVQDLGYTLKTAQVVDMFPQTDHVESVALFEL